MTAHCGMPGHEKKDCSWAKEAEHELKQEALRRQKRKEEGK